MLNNYITGWSNLCKNAKKPLQTDTIIIKLIIYLRSIFHPRSFVLNFDFSKEIMQSYINKMKNMMEDDIQI